jgi:hypothetical protein
MDRSSFLKSTIFSALGVAVARQAPAQNISQRKVVKHNIEITINGRKPGEKASYQEWVYTDFTKSDSYLSSGDYISLEKEVDKLYNSLRWYLNRFKFEDIKTWEDRLKDADKLKRTEAMHFINTISNKLTKILPLTNCQSEYHRDWSKQVYYNTLTTLGEFNLILEKNEDAYIAFDLIKKSFTPYSHEEFKETNNPFQWPAQILNENALYEKAYEFAKLDQEHRVDGTNSRLFKQLSKKLNHVQ